MTDGPDQCFLRVSLEGPRNPTAIRDSTGGGGVGWVQLELVALGTPNSVDT